MNRPGLAPLVGRVEGDVRFDEPLARYTTYRIGGPARAMVFPASEADVAAAVAFAEAAGIPWIALGLGSNVLVADAGFDGIVVRIGKGLDAIAVSEGAPDLWSVGAGLPTPILARRTAAAGWAGVHRLIGVPGAVGGGVVMNAGAHGQDYGSVVRSVRVVEGPQGALREIAGGDIPWRYRASGLEGTVVVGATLSLTPDEPNRLTEELEAYLARRRDGTPFNEPCCGSVFRNPEGDAGGRSAGRLIEAAGLKGARVGGAQVSTKHANYIVNAGNATAADVLALIDRVREEVRRAESVELALEVRLIGS